jgi:hypothetical protein
MDGVGPADRVRRGLGQAERPYLAGVDELAHRTDGILDRHVGIDAMQVVEVDRLDTQPSKARVTGRACMLGRAVDAPRVGRFGDEAELGREHDLVGPPREHSAEQLLVVALAVPVGGVEERHTEIERASQHGRRLCVVAWRVGHAHAPVSEPRHP